MALEDDFDAAMETSRAATLHEEQKTGFYSLMMQSTVGDASGDRPSDPEEAARFDAWRALFGTATEEAKQRFVDLAKTLPPTPQQEAATRVSPDSVTLVSGALHNPDEPRHFMQIVPAGRRITVTIGGQTIADSTNALVVKEVGGDVYEPMFYFPRTDVNMDQLSGTDKTSHCPLKGDTEYFDATIGEQAITDAAWSYVQTIAGPQLEGLIAFDPSHFETRAA